MTLILLAIGGLGFAIAIAIAGLAVRAAQRPRRNAVTRQREEEESRQMAEVHRHAEQDARLDARRRRRIEVQARVATHQQAQRRAEEEACVAAKAETQGRGEEEKRRETEAKARHYADEQALPAGQAEARHRVEEEARVVAGQQAQRRAEKEARIAAEAEAQRRAEEEKRLEAELETRHRADDQVRNTAQAEARRRVEEEACVAAAAETQRRIEEGKRRKAKEAARIAADQEGQRQDEEQAHRKAEEARVAVAGESHRDTEAEARHQDPLAEDLAAPTIPNAPAAPVRAGRQYQPVARVPAARVVPRPPESVSLARETRNRALPIEVRLVFEKAGFCRVSLLPRRAEGMPTELVVTGSGNPPELLALQDEWYQDVVLPNLGHLLRKGIEWAGFLPEHDRFRASLSGRDIYVLARHNEISGFVSTPRLILGEEHVVLCVEERLSEVRIAIALTGSPEPTLLNVDNGIPAGWAGLRGVVPRTPIAPSPDGDILDALRPRADVEIALVGGIRIDRQSWLTSFPPNIRLRGDTSTIGAVTIDGHETTVTPEGNYIVPGWDSPGDHSVWCTSGSRTYSIRSGAEEWQAWDAYKWSLGELAAQASLSRPGICGVLVRAPNAGRSDGRAVVVPSSNLVLIGAAPGEIEICTPRSDMRARFCVGFPGFEPIWAIPVDAFHCDKHTARVLLIGSPQSVVKGEQQPSAHPGVQRARFHHDRSRRIRAWCAAILTAGGKGLQAEPSRAEIADLWKAYKRSAKALRRSSR